MADPSAEKPTPPFGVPFQVAEGVLQIRLPIPFALDHVNVYLLKDGDGWLAVDTGTDSAQNRDHWRQFLSALDGPLTRIVLTHHHIDHAGAAKWLSDQVQCPVIMTPREREALALSLEPYPEDVAETLFVHYLALGCADDEARAVAEMRLRVEMFVSGMPERIETIESGDTMRIGAHDWRIETGAGHTWDSLIAKRADGRIAIVGDQILTHISPFIGVFMNSYDKNPLATYYAFLREMARTLDNSTLLLPGHRPVFSGGARRAIELAAHHDARCAKVVAACAHSPQTTRSLVDVLFDRDLSEVMILALAETQAHVAYLLNTGVLQQCFNGQVCQYTSV